MQRATTKALFLTTLFGALTLEAHLFGAHAHAVDRTVADTESVDAFDQTLGDASTRFRTRGAYRGRAINVELAAKLLDGAVIAPGAELSFDAVVGERTAERGFRNAPVIANGQLRRGIGGGVCQVASTLHLASLRSGLEVVDHRTHTLPSSYLDPGLDARIAWGTQDYRVRNPHAFAVRVRATASEGRLAITIEGAEALRHDVRTELVRELPAAEQVVLDPTLPPGEVVVENEGRDGLVVRVVIVDSEGRTTSTLHRYAPSARVIRRGA
jgi:vancomycin resistance protein YoaR